MSEEEEEVETVEAPALVVPPTRVEQVRAARGARRWTWIARGVGVAIVIAIIGFGAYLAVANAGGRSERLEILEQLDDERAENAELRDQADALYEQIIAAGEDPVVDPADVTEATTTAPRGDKGDRGEPGRPPTMAEILAAFNAYCAANNGCRGSDGTTIVGPEGPPGIGTQGPKGDKGDPGDASTVPGPQGPQGVPGDPGASGISVIGIYCAEVAPLSTVFRFTMSDGTTIDVAGSCIPAA